MQISNYKVLKFLTDAMKTTGSRKAVGALSLTGAVALIAGYEGFSNTAYLPTPDDVPTIGYGQTEYSDGTKVKMGDTITREDAKMQLQIITRQKYADALGKCVKVPLSQNEYDAFLSLAYNIGPGAFCGSTLVKKLNQKDYAGACSQILRWKYQKGKVLKGLVNRRQKEYKLCLGETA